MGCPAWSAARQASTPTVRRARWLTAAIVAALVCGLCTSASAAPPPVDPSVPLVATPVTTNLTLFVGSGIATGYLVDPGPPTLLVSSWNEFEELVENPSLDLEQSVQAFFENGGIGAWILVTADDTASTLSRTLDAWPGAPQPAVVNLVTVPALGGFSGADYDRVAKSLGAVAERTTSFAILEPPRSMVATAVASDDVTPLASHADHLRSILPASQQIRSALYVTSLPGDLYDATLAATPALPVSGVVAGIMASTDTSRGVWKAPAGATAGITGSPTSPFQPTSAQYGGLNVQGVNSIISMPGPGLVVWGARTLAGADLLNSPWKYLSTRRLADFIELTLQQSFRWAVFEPNDQTLWSSLERETAAFMTTLFSQGAFGGTTPEQAFRVQVDATTTTPADQQNGIVNLVVTFALTWPVDFIQVPVQLEAAPAS